jgi:hypothetical protein
MFEPYQLAASGAIPTCVLVLASLAAIRRRYRRARDLAFFASALALPILWVVCVRLPQQFVDRGDPLSPESIARGTAQLIPFVTWTAHVFIVFPLSLMLGVVTAWLHRRELKGARPDASPEVAVGADKDERTE